MDVFRALSDPSRRELLDSLNARGAQSLSELCAGLEMTRQSVSKHLVVLEEANLIATTRRGREKLHFLNPAPINEIAAPWISRYDPDPDRRLSGAQDAYAPEPETRFGEEDEPASANAGAEPAPHLSFELEAQGELVQLTLTRDSHEPQPPVLATLVSRDWPGVVSGLRSLLGPGPPDQPVPQVER